MCEPISWIERDNKFYYNTDKENEILVQKGSSWDDTLGHSAIEKLWEITGKHLQNPVGANTPKIPNEIWDALVEGRFNKTLKENHYHLEAKKVGRKQVIHVKYFYSDGQLGYEGDYTDGKETGHWKRFYYNGQLDYEGDYVDGKQSGHWKSFHSDGQLAYEGDYTDGKRVGRQKNVDK